MKYKIILSIVLTFLLLELTAAKAEMVAVEAPKDVYGVCKYKDAYSKLSLSHEPAPLTIFRGLKKNSF